MWHLTSADVPSILITIASLILLEGLLSADNALVLAVMVRHLPKDQQKRALRYGIWGAFIFRGIAIVFATLLLQFWQLKVIGGLYLIYLSLRHLLGPKHDESADAKVRPGMGFWATVVNVEIADIAFSIDSILAAVALIEGMPKHLQDNKTLAMEIIYIGGILGIIMMRLVAGVFLVVLDRFKGLAAGAYYLVAWIGIKLVESGFFAALHPKTAPPPGGWRDQVPDIFRLIPEMPDWVFWTGMITIIVISLLYKPRNAQPQGTPASEPETPTTPPIGPTADAEVEPAQAPPDAAL
ncbi:MAG: hypothetical protein ABI353_00960 [Isosphaeraceae bacterium]